MKRHGKIAAPLLLPAVLALTACGGGSKEAASGTEQKPQIIGGNGTGKGRLRAVWTSALTAALCC